MVSLSIMIISARAGASELNYQKFMQLTWEHLRTNIKTCNFPNSLPEILTGIRVAVGMCWGTLVAAEF